MNHAWALAAAMLAVAGCSAGGGDDLPREAVSGVVTLDGQPLADGVIHFGPQPSGPTEGGGLIRNGNFSIDRESGLVPGTYIVTINATEKLGSQGKEGSPAPTGGGRVGRPSKELIPARYNSRSDLKTEIKKGGSNGALKFDLVSK